ncbi:MAG: hypothetical protein EOM31_02730 [Bacteroidia bacterium]|nr:hypothetical protein [Bacteroidia bacterium]
MVVKFLLKEIIIYRNYILSSKPCLYTIVGTIKYIVALGNYLAASSINYWIYGHSHRNINHCIGQPLCLSNQLGYVLPMSIFHSI